MSTGVGAPAMPASPSAAPPPTAPAPATDPPPSGRRGRRTGRRGAATYVGLVGLGLLLVVLLALSAQRPTALLDPEGTGPEGGRALAEVLRGQGVEVEVVRSVEELERSLPDARTTVFLGDPTNLGTGAAARLAASGRPAGRMVVLGVDSRQLDALGLPVAGYPGGGDEVTARCRSDIARAGDVVTDWATRYLPRSGGSGSRSCFVLPSDDGPPDQPDPRGASGAVLVELDATAARPETVVAGLGPSWTNSAISQASNAGPAVRALGSTARLVWYQPGTADLLAPGPGQVGQPDPGSVWPAWTAPATALLGCTVVILALVRGRRLGRLVREPLPVVVRAIETTESRGRLYRRAGDRSRAAAVLRAGTRERLAHRLAVPRAAHPAALVAAVCSATGRPEADIVSTLFGPPPPDDASLIQLAQQLTDLEERLRHP